MSAASRNTPCGSRKGIHMEIERKYLVKILPDHLEQYPCRQIEQGYLSTNPVVRIRRSNDRYILTYKGKGLMVREEYNLPLNEESFTHLKEKIDGLLIQKRRYLIPFAENIPLSWMYLRESLPRSCSRKSSLRLRRKRIRLSRPSGSARTSRSPQNTTTVP